MRQLKRRNFLILGSLLGISPYLSAKAVSRYEKEFKEVENTIKSVQEHMFPPSSKLPSAQSTSVTKFLFETMMHKSFDKDIKAFVLEGAKELELREKGRFVSMQKKEKEHALREYEKTSYGSSWLSRIMTLTMEGMFSDPIYGSNIKEAGWKSVDAYGGYPRAKIKYMGL